MGWGKELDIAFKLIAGTTGMLLLSGGLMFFFRVYRRRLIKEQQEKNELELKYRDDLLYANISATETERFRIASDLHDEIGASLALLRMQVRSLPPQELSEARIILDNAIDTVKRIVYDLHPPSLTSFGLVTALRQHFDSVMSGTSINITLIAFDEKKRLADLIELSVYRIIQELTHNTVKHSGATTINVDIYIERDKLIVRYKDDGKGYVPDILQKDNGLGIKNIELRVKQCNGVLQYTRVDDDKICVNIQMPLMS